MKLSTARAHVAVLAKKLEAEAPYLDFKDLKAHGPIVSGLLDGEVSPKDLRAVRTLPEKAARDAAYADRRGADVEALTREIATDNVDRAWSGSDIALVWPLYRPDLLETAMAKVTPEELEERAGHYQQQADWYRKGEKLAEELVSAVEAQVEAQPNFTSWESFGVTAKDRLIHAVAAISR